MSVRVKDNTIEMGEKGSCVQLELMRTLRVPDDGKIYPLPATHAKFPLKRIDDFKDKVPDEWIKTGGLFFPMRQREAMWMNFNCSNILQPKAIKIATGKINSISGKEWTNELSKDSQDYIVVPDQKWVDGINAGDGYIKQFVAMPQESNYTIENQVTGKSKYGGIQVIMYNKKEEEEEENVRERFRRYRTFNSCTLISDDERREYRKSMRTKFGGKLGGNIRNSNKIQSKNTTPKEMGISAGGKIKQKIIDDPYGVDRWDQSKFTRIYIRIVSTSTYKEITGEEPPPEITISVKSYTEKGCKWFDKSEENIDGVGKSSILSKVKSVKETDKSVFAWKQQDDTSVVIPSKNVVKYD